MAEEYCWAITQMVCRSRCGLTDSSVSDFEFLNWTALYIHTCFQFQLAKNYTRDGHFVKVTTAYVGDCLYLRVRVKSSKPHDSGCSGRDSNCAPSEHKTEALALHKPAR